WELLIWDDGCDDDTCSYVESLADPRVHILHGTRSHGDPLVLNRAYFQLVQAAAGPLICSTTDGSIWHPDKLKRQLAAFAADPDLVLACSPVWLIDEAGNPLPEMSKGGAPAFGDNPLLALCAGNCVPGPTVMLRRDDYLRDNGADSSFLYSADYHHWLWLSLHGTFHFDTEALIGYRLHGKSSSQLPRVQRLWELFNPTALEHCLATPPANRMAASDFRERAGFLAERYASASHPGILWELAIMQLRQALAIAPEDMASRSDLVCLLAKVNRFDEANQLQPGTTVGEDAIEPLAAAWQGMLHDHLVEARRAWRLTLPPVWQPQQAWQAVSASMRGWVAWQAGDAEAAGDHWMEAYAIQSHDPITLLNLGHHLAALQFHKAAQRVWELAAALRPEDAGLRALLGHPVSVRIFAVSPSEMVTRLLAIEGCHVTVGGPFRPNAADVVLLQDEQSLALLECDPAPVFLWPDGRSDHGIAGLHADQPLADQIRAHLMGPRRRYLPWGDPPLPQRQTLPTQKGHHWLVWAKPESVADLEQVIRTYLQNCRSGDDCCLVVACDTEVMAVDDVGALMRRVVGSVAGDLPALTLLARAGIRFEGLAIVGAMSALIAGPDDASLQVLATTLEVPVVVGPSPDLVASLHHLLSLAA
ncbi:MAG: glycosyltransferase, partial [Candidatus Sericytochromatia bacterium]|nr:glycosyltransferase [Candidatus Sericytochromatia bacterium]